MVRRGMVSGGNGGGPICRFSRLATAAAYSINWRIMIAGIDALRKHCVIVSEANVVMEVNIVIRVVKQ